MANSHLQENFSLPSQINPNLLKRVKDFTDFKDISDTLKYFRLSLPLRQIFILPDIYCMLPKIPNFQGIFKCHL